ncbi:MAG: hypothetical protein AAFZ52_14550, partial [Bacteroidota bacterium]
VVVTPMCDDGNAIYFVVVYNDTTTTASATGYFELDLTTSYTPSGTVTFGPCATTVNATLSRTISSTTGTITAGAFSYEICNEGTEDGTVTIDGGTAAKLVPGACTSYRAVWNPATREFRVAPVVTYDATGTEFVVITEN